MFIDKEFSLVNYSESEAADMVRKYLDDNYLAELADKLRKDSNYNERDIDLLIKTIPIFKNYIINMIHGESNATRSLNGIRFADVVKAYDSLEWSKLGGVIVGTAYFTSRYESYRRVIMAEPESCFIVNSPISARDQILTVYSTGITNEYYIIEYYSYTDPVEYMNMRSLIPGLQYARLTVLSCSEEYPEGEVIDDQKAPHPKGADTISKMFVQVVDKIRSENEFVMFDAKKINA